MSITQQGRNPIMHATPIPSRRARFAAWAAVSALAVLTAGCPGNDSSGGGNATFEDSVNSIAILDDFVDKVVVPTYQLLASRAAALQSASETLRTTPDDANLAAAQAAWVAMREPWELSEGFLFGPVDANGYDPSLDTWPVNVTDLDAVLAGGATLTPAFVAGLDTSLQGFHTAEYLLFGVGAAKTAADLTARELDYLVAITTVMADVAGDLADDWTGGTVPYGDVFRTAGDPGNAAYPSRDAAAQEIIGGITGILDEVANGKIADPFDLADTTLVESQFSFNSLDDFTHNVMSAENAYLGRGPDGIDTGTGIDAYVAEMDPTLDQQVKDLFDDAFTALAAVPRPFRDAILDPDAADEIEAAQEAIRAVHDVLQGDVLPLVS
jgi:putative iron-regulated protein